jgi:hypothetical protein
MSSDLDYALSRLPGQLRDFARTLDVREVNRQLVDAHVSDVDGKILLYPSLRRLDRTVRDEELLTVFLTRYCGTMMSEALRERWEKKLCTPTRDHANAAVVLVRTCHARGMTYAQVLKTQSGAVNRLVTLNLMNALIYHGIKPADAAQHDVINLPCAADYLAGRRYHSLTPLVGAYCPDIIGRCLGRTAAKLFIHGHVPSSESTLRDALDVLTREILTTS